MKLDTFKIKFTFKQDMPCILSIIIHVMFMHNKFTSHKQPQTLTKWITKTDFFNNHILASALYFLIHQE